MSDVLKPLILDIKINPKHKIIVLYLNALTVYILSGTDSKFIEWFANKVDWTNRTKRGMKIEHNDAY